MTEIFLSYASPDTAFASRLAEDLERRKVDVWYDQKLQLGENWRNTISRKLQSAEVVIVLVSPESLRSQWVSVEWQTALARSARIIPVLVNGAHFRDLPARLADIQAVDLSDNYDHGLASLVSTVGNLAASHEPPAVEAIDLKRIVDDVTVQVLARLGVKEEYPAGTPVSPDDKLVFVICSFRPEMEPVFDAIAAAAKSVGLRAERVKDVRGDYRITDRMLSMIRRARLVVADLTDERPNVYFELGYARGIGKTVITILKRGTEVHFDVRDWTYIEYFDSRPLELELRRRFEHELHGIAV